MLYLYIGSTIISYLIMKSGIKEVEKELKEKNLHAKETENDKIDKKILLFIIACLPVINLVIAIINFFDKETLYNTIKKVQCEMIIQDDKELLNKYEKICNSGNEQRRRKLEKEISLLAIN